MRKEIIEKMAVEMEGQIKSLYTEEKEALEIVKNNNQVSSFQPHRIESDYLYRGEEDSYRVEWKHITQDVDFYYSQSNGVDRISWSSWSYSHIEPQEKEKTFKKSIAYISAVKEMLELQQEETQLKEVTEKVVEEYKQSVLPIREKIRQADRELREIQEEIKKIEKEELEQKMKETVVEGKYEFVSDSVHFSSKNWSKQIEIKKDKKGNLVVADSLNEWGKNHKMTPELLSHIYSCMTKMVRDWRYDNENPDDKYERTPYITSNLKTAPGAEVVWTREYKK